MKIPVFNPTIRRKDLDAVLTCMVDNKLGSGELVDSLLSSVASRLGHVGGIVVRDPGKGMRLLYQILCEENKKQILVSALAPSYFADASTHSVASLELCDVDPKTALLTQETVTTKKKDNTAALILSDTLGNLVNPEEFISLGLPIIRDVSASFGLTIKTAEEEGEGQQLLGSSADYCLLSLEPDSMVTGGGGLIITARNRNNVGKLKRILATYSDETTISDLNASLAQIQVSTVEETFSRRREIFAIYRDALIRNKKETLNFSPLSEGFFYAFPILLDMDAREIIKYTAKKGVEIRFAFEGVLLSQMTEVDCPHALSLMNRCLIFPLYPMLSSEDCKIISKLISTVA